MDNWPEKEKHLKAASLPPLPQQLFLLGLLSFSEPAELQQRSSSYQAGTRNPDTATPIKVMSELLRSTHKNVPVVFLMMTPTRPCKHGQYQRDFSGAHSPKVVLIFIHQPKVGARCDLYRLHRKGAHLCHIFGSSPPTQK